MGTVNTVVVEDARALEEAVAVVENEIRAIDATCSRFRDDSELSRLNRAAGSGFVGVSPLLEEALLAALMAAEMTDGLVDPTVGKAIADAGYAVTFTAIVDDGAPANVTLAAVPGWRAIERDAGAHAFRLPAGTCVDLGASGKAWAADRAAGAVAATLGVAVAVECGGDVAVSGPHPQGGWPVRVAAADDAAEWQDVLIFDGGLATSGTTSRRWRRNGVEMHHIIDPATGLPAETPWTMATVAAATCLEANAAATAALIMGPAALEWLDGLRLPARLVDRDRGVHHAGGWGA
ncbi:MAG TPA: FAD:protein FMN transferase [Candidatus Dormibacteraeota bacterium]|nr:FAD:protein FMN transferase [Candidatus Dormibacteraeota bacterium]